MIFSSPGHDEAGAPGWRHHEALREEAERRRGARDQEEGQLGGQAQARRRADHVRGERREYFSLCSKLQLSNLHCRLSTLCCFLISQLRLIFSVSIMWSFRI